jgi:hypothetical protein
LGDDIPNDRESTIREKERGDDNARYEMRYGLLNTTHQVRQQRVAGGGHCALALVVGSGGGVCGSAGRGGGGGGGGGGGCCFGGGGALDQRGHLGGHLAIAIHKLNPFDSKLCNHKFVTRRTHFRFKF